MMQIGEAYVGDGVNAAHINTVLGDRNGPVGTAWATALATPTVGHVRFLVVARPGVAVQPPTLFVNKSPLLQGNVAGARITWGAAQAGVAGGVMDAIRAGVIEVADNVLIAAVWVDPSADDEQLVYANNRAATAAALDAGCDNGPTVEQMLAVDEPFNPFFPSQDDD
jgi:5,6,7,8-tetrahydromethanopterin hydro-lyase